MTQPTFLLDDLRSHVLQNPCVAHQRLIPDDQPGQPIVREFQVPFWRDQHIFGLEVPIYDVIGMQETNCLDDLGNQLPYQLLREFLMSQVVVQIASLHELHYDVDFLLVLENAVDLRQERVVGGSQHLLDVVRLQ